jgi:hypothetical protein
VCHIVVCSFILSFYDDKWYKIDGIVESVGKIAFAGNVAGIAPYACDTLIKVFVFIQLGCVEILPKALAAAV